ncbi:hypothetical protein K1W69_11965 [Hoeflea sp. WL0058]|uniref:Uncharacterized protein n=1 Tax=Flavimaribacter sediminis TaxID=2865987 RepID=A0AAE2ZKV3_9HYPH|nr:hypothetical protein [Flavimaribacter sediminis]MBW8637904.1 hypothetical protein [Flavimaribacter sediminis]
MIPSLDEVGHYLRGVWLLIRNDPAGMQYLDFSNRGFWRSFWAYFYMLPVYIYSWIDLRNVILASDPQASPGLDFFLRQAAESALTIATFLALLALLSRPLGFSHRFGHWLIASNWYGLAFSYVLTAPQVLHRFMPESPLPALLTFTLIIFSIWASFRVYRRVLADNAPVAIFIIAMEFGWVFLTYYLFG